MTSGGARPLPRAAAARRRLLVARGRPRRAGRSRPDRLPRAARASRPTTSARALAPLSTALELAWDTAILACGVVVATLLVGVPFAWLVVRTDLPGRRLWGLAASLPLVIPSFVAALALLGALAPRGLVQEVLEPLGVERLPEVTGYWGALVALTLATYPYVYLLAAVGSAKRRPDRGGGRAQPRRRPSSVCSRASPCRRFARRSPPRRCSSLCTSSPTSASSRSWGTRRSRPASTSATSRCSRSSRRRSSPSCSSRSRSRSCSSRPAGGCAERSTAARPAPDGARGSCSSGLALAGARVLLCGRRAVPRPSAGRPRRGGQSAPTRSPGRAGVAWSAARPLGLRGDGGSGHRRRSSCFPQRSSPGAIPSALARWLERLTLLPSALPGIAVALALVFVGARIGSPVYQSIASAPGRLRHPLHAVRARLDARIARRGQPSARGGSAIARPAAARRDDRRSSCRSRARACSRARHSSS